jgi:ribosomal silencing factor RsfS
MSKRYAGVAVPIPTLPLIIAFPLAVIVLTDIVFTPIVDAVTDDVVTIDPVSVEYPMDCVVIVDAVIIKAIKVLVDNLLNSK